MKSNQAGNTDTSRPRVVIYGVGQYGGYLARFAIEKGWPIVAAFNRAGPKVGRDIGQVVGLGRDIGVVVQDCDTARYDNLEADIAFVAQTNLLRINIAAYRRLLSAGLNVLCHGGESYYPYGNDAALAAEIDELARKNNVTFTGGGIWDMSRIWAGILVAGPCTELRALHHSSITDVHGQCVNWAQAEQVGSGFTVEEFAAKNLDQSPVAKQYKSIPEHVLAALGYTITRTEVRLEPVVLEKPVYSSLYGGTIAAGRVAGTRIIADIYTKEGVTADATIDLRVFYEGEVEHMLWEVDGMPHTRVRTERRDSAHATASCLFNRTLDVLAAPPGIVPVSKLGPLKHTALLQTT